MGGHRRVAGHVPRVQTSGIPRALLQIQEDEELVESIFIVTVKPKKIPGDTNC